MPPAESSVRRRILDLLARHSGVSEQEIDPEASVWDCFPDSSANRAGQRAVEAFCAEVEREFGVFLTEEEWESPTVDALVETVASKIGDPARSAGDWRKERAALRSGTIQVVVFYNALVALAFFVVDENEKWAS